MLDQFLTGPVTAQLVAFLDTGLLDFAWWQIVLATLALTHVTIVTVTVYLHRCAAHRALDMHPALAHFFRGWLWLTTGMVTRQWASIHRKHHVTCETEDDPHSPQIHGLGKIMREGAEFYRKANTPEVVAKYGKNLPNSWVDRNVYERYSALGVTIMLFTDLALFGAAGLAVWAVQMLWIPMLAAGVINGIGHYWGYRNFECPDAATNIVPWGILIGGEELHNNHHTYPNSAKLSVKPFEFDIGWAYIKVFEAFGLVKVRSTGPVVAREPGKAAIDIDTVWGMVNDRFRVMSRFADEVVAPLVEQEKARADAARRRVLKRAKALLVREESLVKADQAATREQIIEEHPTLAKVYEFRVRLQEVIQKRTGNREELLRAFNEWCREAEESGIQVLRDFVEELKAYTVPQRAAAV